MDSKLILNLIAAAVVIVVVTVVIFGQWNWMCAHACCCAVDANVVLHLNWQSAEWDKPKINKINCECKQTHAQRTHPNASVWSWRWRANRVTQKYESVRWPVVSGHKWKERRPLLLFATMDHTSICVERHREATANRNLLFSPLINPNGIVEMHLHFELRVRSPQWPVVVVHTDGHWNKSIDSQMDLSVSGHRLSSRSQLQRTPYFMKQTFQSNQNELKYYYGLAYCRLLHPFRLCAVCVYARIVCSNNSMTDGHLFVRCWLRLMGVWVAAAAAGAHLTWKWTQIPIQTS